MKTSCLIGLFVVSLSTTGGAYAQLAAWEVTGVNAAANNPLAATTVGANIASASATLGGGVSASSANDTFGASSFNTTSLGGALTDGDYLSFIITPAAAYTVSFTSWSYLGGLASATNFNVALFSSATGFTSPDALDTYVFSSASPSSRSITLSSIPALQGVTSATEFRLYGWRDAAGTSTFRIRSNAGNDLTIAGTTALAPVPEPSTYAAILGGAALAGAAFIRRRRRLPASVV